MWGNRKYSKEDFIQAWNSSTTASECARKLGLSAAGGTVDRLRKMARELELQEKEPAYKKGFSPRKIPTEDILIENSTYTHPLRKRLIKEGFFEEKCSRCGITEWQGSSAPLQLDHINGINNDNRIENLRLLCANCHALTDTFGTKNLKRKVEPKKCIDCKSEIRQQSTRCKRCAQILRGKKKSSFPGADVLVDSLNRNRGNMTKTGKEFGVTGNAVKKWIAKYDIVLK